MLCSKCKILPAVLKSNGKTTGFCRPCKREYGRLHYEKNKAPYIQRARKQKEDLKAWLHKQKDWPCADCHIKYPYWIMQFDHIRGIKLYSISALRWAGTKRKAELEIEKCELVCANCHADRTYKRQQNSIP